MAVSPLTIHDPISDLEKLMILSFKSHSIRNPESARVSVPSYLVPSPSARDPGQNSKQIWRTDLLATEPYWEGQSSCRKRSVTVLKRVEWYAGLSSRFLSAKCARMLVLAGQERLDKDLMVGQMSVPNCAVISFSAIQY